MFVTSSSDTDQIKQKCVADCVQQFYMLAYQYRFNTLMYGAFAIELSDLSKPFKFARLKGFERLENCLTKGTYERF